MTRLEGPLVALCKGKGTSGSSFGFEDVLIRGEQAGFKRQFCALTPKRRPLLREDSSKS